MFAGHQGVVKTYLTMKDKFFIPNLMHYLRSFKKGCHVCQLSRSNKLPARQLCARAQSISQCVDAGQLNILL